ncbi:hypothetical protein A8L34_27680 [Bacillus sp. FJAT-27264]|uniref:hypothetical protein n=1 Tax=Paenibacillus sp. (strain DSM 101736 / FJAT-27264) TaxID=1850362 RepID=UPI00080804FF|nr:hypothetical protein [Bacillus sp. FJAT-27264]OBZ15832.1 hypothetical protein A8L34_27680 [Bacillus sp. FJAT-27264]
MSEVALHIQSQISYELANNNIQRLFAMMFSPYMNAYPIRRSSRKKAVNSVKYDTVRPWVFIGPVDSMKAVATLSSLFGCLDDPNFESTYFTPVSFYRRNQRIEVAARWIHAITLDIDVKGKYEHLSGITLQDVLDRIQDAGLPIPTFVVQTPSGGFQPSWILSNPVRATEKARTLFKIVQKHMAMDIEADLQATGVANVFRTPTLESLVYFEHTQVYDFQTFIDWREINHPRAAVATSWDAERGSDIMTHPAIRKLLTQPAMAGTRDNTCFTLALAAKFSGYSQELAESALEEWFFTCVERGGKTPLTIRKVCQIVERVYQSEKLRGPSPLYIKMLTDMEFQYDNVRYYTTAKDRSDRARSHLTESKQDLLNHLTEHTSVSGSLKQLSMQLEIPESTLKLVMRQCQDEGTLRIETKRGRNGSTTLTKVDPPQDKEPVKKPEKDNVISYDFRNKKKMSEWKRQPNSEQASQPCSSSNPSIINSYTSKTIDRGVGGLSFLPESPG